MDGPAVSPGPRDAAAPTTLAALSRRNLSADLPPLVRQKKGSREDPLIPRVPSPPLPAVESQAPWASRSNPLVLPLSPSRPPSRSFSCPSRQRNPRLSRALGCDDLLRVALFSPDGNEQVATPSVPPSPSSDAYLATPDSRSANGSPAVPKVPARPKQRLQSLLPWSLFVDEVLGRDAGGLPALPRPKPPVARFGPRYSRPTLHASPEEGEPFSLLPTSQDFAPVMRAPQPPPGVPSQQYLLPSRLSLFHRLSPEQRSATQRNSM
jgi:hypothetical protein